ncbi:MAG: RES family NAD+ phosphorylase [Cytophagales bacterium]
MIELYRISQTRYANDFSGEGSRLYGARWNNMGTPCIYTAENRALSLCELFCSSNMQTIVPRLSLLTYSIETEQIFTINVNDLPINWNEIKHPNETKNYGTELIHSNKYAVIKVPSVIMEEEYNCIVNIFHPDFKSFKIKHIRPFNLDARFGN